MANAKRPSVTLTALIWLGMLLTLAGAIFALLGVGAAVDFKAKIGESEVTTTNLGLAVMATGAILAAAVATNLPKGVTTFAVHKQTWQDRFSDHAGWLVAFAILIVLLFAFSLWKH
jgi:hypothetical protein